MEPSDLTRTWAIRNAGGKVLRHITADTRIEAEETAERLRPYLNELGPIFVRPDSSCTQ